LTHVYSFQLAMEVKRTACARMIAVVALAILVASCGDGKGGGQSTGAGSPATAPGDATPEAFPEGTVPAVLAADGRFETLLRILREDAPALLGFMTDERYNGTLFAPTDEAFEALPADTLEQLRGKKISTSVSALVFVLQHHTVAGQWRSTDLKKLNAVGPGRTEGAGGHGGPIAILVRRGDILVDGVTVIEEDVEASNGLVHVIDGVMIPENVNPS
jgi:uncharacterized surface protein with fasciclin (FAS1) repeats